jgi:hypothetical protein
MSVASTYDDATSPTKKTITVTHGTITRQTDTTVAASSDTTEAAGSQLTIPVITDVTLSNGHVTKFEKTNYVVTDTNATLNSVTNTSATTSSNGTYTTTINTAVSLDHVGGSYSNDTQSGSFSLNSSTLQMTTPANSTATTINLVWGTF